METKVTAGDLLQALQEVPAASGMRSLQLQRRFETHGIALEWEGQRALRSELKRLLRMEYQGAPPRVESLLLTAGGGGAGVTALGVCLCVPCRV